METKMTWINTGISQDHDIEWERDNYTRWYEWFTTEGYGKAIPPSEMFDTCMRFPYKSGVV